MYDLYIGKKTEVGKREAAKCKAYLPLESFCSSCKSVPSEKLNLDFWSE